jgi:segregation and condensation protein A
MSGYRVNLDIYSGPLDLLLFLIRREEVDIYDIPIARITAQYIKYVDVLQQLDPNMAGEFLVMAATLMEVKTRLLLPAAPAEEGGPAESLEVDPRAELVRQLLEYKAFKDAAGDLRDAADVQALRFPRRPAAPEDDGREVDIEDVHLWDLLDAFGKVMDSIGATKPLHQVIYDDTPVELHAADIIDRLQREGALTFTRIFEGRATRTEVIGLFLALLELVRLKKVFIGQGDNFGEINVVLNPNPPEDSPFAQPDGSAQSPVTEPNIASFPEAQEPEPLGSHVDDSAIAEDQDAEPSHACTDIDSCPDAQGDADDARGKAESTGA